MLFEAPPKMLPAEGAAAVADPNGEAAAGAVFDDPPNTELAVVDAFDPAPNTGAAPNPPAPAEFDAPKAGGLLLPPVTAAPNAGGFPLLTAPKDGIPPEAATAPNVDMALLDDAAEALPKILGGFVGAVVLLEAVPPNANALLLWEVGCEAAGNVVAVAPAPEPNVNVEFAEI